MRGGRKKNFIRLLACVLLLALGMSLGACAPRMKPARTADGNNLFRLGFSGTPDSLNPYAAGNEEAAAVLSLLYDTLFARDLETGEYGAFSLLVQWYARPCILFEVPPGCFTPRPKVTSAVVRLETRQAPPAPVTDRDFFFAVVRAAFNQRRKTLPNAVSAGVAPVDRRMAEEALEKLGLPLTVRGEALSLEQFAALSELLWQMGKEDRHG